MRKKVSVVLAVYYPNLTFLRKQLLSINEQTYPLIEVIICDDSNDDTVYKQLGTITQQIINKFPVKLIRNDNNIGSNKTFERLTIEATGDYICYSDQDDIWEVNKVEKLVKSINEENGILAYSDLSMINENDELMKSSFKASNPRLIHISGEDCFRHFIRRNSVTGCAMIIKSDVAKKACPFPIIEIFPHDHWLAIYASVMGKIVYVDEQLVKYRIHSNNQIGNKRLIGVNNLNDYFYLRISLQRERMDLINEKCLLNNKQQYFFDYEKVFLEARDAAYRFRNLKAMINLLKYIKIDPVLIIFEIGLVILPRKVATFILNSMKK